MKKIVKQETFHDYNYNGNNISFLSGKNVMVNAVQMAKPFGKRAVDWLQNQNTKEFLDELSKVRKSTLADLVTVTKGGNKSGTWMHEDVALEFARWLSPVFALWCNDRIKELLRYGITATQLTLEQMLENPDLVINLATQLKQERSEKERLSVQAEQQSKELKEAAPKVEYYDKVLQSTTTYTSTFIAKELGFKNAKEFHTTLKNAGVIYKQSDRWMLKAKYCGKYYYKTKTFPYMDGLTGEQRTNVYMVWTERGRRFLHEFFGKIVNTTEKE